MSEVWHNKDAVDKDVLYKLESSMNLPPDKNEPCFNCGGDPAVDCGFGEYTNNTNGADFDCLASDGGFLECPCYHTWCDNCKNQPIIIIEREKIVMNPKFMEDGKEYEFEFLDIPMFVVKDEDGINLYSLLGV